MAEEQKHGCETCPIRQRAEANPKSFVAWLWRFHTKFCPGWKAYQRSLAEQKQA
ncbi:MAG: hypothetical protein JXA10_07095 [Anaerolineae bacterium]|nr:hypothetical protein [Anaerolineae bacterium]